MPNIRSQRKRLSDAQILEIYSKILEKKRLYNVPCNVSIKCFGRQSWGAFSTRAKKILDKGN
ncbi:MAG: hypothetical protein DDT19_02657 [Syntrophomonadaceae bacterium]|nr:hypothetical protein [Bacillota bacterium]